MASFTIQELKNRISSFGIDIPNKGSGKGGRLLKRDLQRLYESLNKYSVYETLFREENPSLWKVIKNTVDSLPDLRPSWTISSMKPEKWNPWLRVYDEVLAMSIPNKDNETPEIDVMAAILNNDSITVLNYINNTSSSFFDGKYPAIMWILSRIAHRNSVVPFLLNAGRYDLFHQNLRVLQQDIAYVGDVLPSTEFVSRFVEKINLPSFFTMVRYKDEKTLIWYYVFERKALENIGVHHGDLLNIAIDRDMRRLSQRILDDHKDDDSPALLRYLLRALQCQREEIAIQILDNPNTPIYQNLDWKVYRAGNIIELIIASRLEKVMTSLLNNKRFENADMLQSMEQ
jgi:hypothetical protein